MRTVDKRRIHPHYDSVWRQLALRLLRLLRGGCGTLRLLRGAWLRLLRGGCGTLRLLRGTLRLLRLLCGALRLLRQPEPGLLHLLRLLFNPALRFLYLLRLLPLRLWRLLPLRLWRLLPLRLLRLRRGIPRRGFFGVQNAGAKNRECEHAVCNRCFHDLGFMGVVFVSQTFHVGK